MSGFPSRRALTLLDRLTGQLREIQSSFKGQNAQDEFTDDTGGFHTDKFGIRLDSTTAAASNDISKVSNHDSGLSHSLDVPEASPSFRTERDEDGSTRDPPGYYRLRYIDYP